MPDSALSVKTHELNYYVGVVTRYDVKTTDNSSYWFEGLYYAPEQSEKLIEAVVDYANAADKDPYSAISFTLNPSVNFVEFIYAKPVKRPSTYSMFYDIPSQSQAINSTFGNMVDMNNAISAINPETYKRCNSKVRGNPTKLRSLMMICRRMIASTAHRFDVGVLKEIFALYLDFDTEATKLGAATGMVVQPFTSAGVQHSASTGGNPIGLNAGLQNRRCN